MSPGQSQDPSFKGPNKFLHIVRMASGLQSKRLNSSKGVLYTMVQLVNQYFLAILGLFAFSNINQHVDCTNELSFPVAQGGRIGDKGNARAVRSLRDSLDAAHWAIFL